MSLWQLIMEPGRQTAGSFHGIKEIVSLASLAHSSIFADRLEELRGRTVVVAIHDQMAAALALIELDGVARRLVVCPPGLPQEYAPGVADSAGADAWVRDSQGLPASGSGISVSLTVEPLPTQARIERRSSHTTEWVLLTSGTTGAPKLVLHSLASLSNIVARQKAPSAPLVWSTFYDIRRYGGLQIFLRAVHGGSLVISSSAESISDFLGRAHAAGATHFTGTPSHWRGVLMSGAASRIEPHYVRLSGEIADQAILDNLRAAFPNARVAHAFASTEAGVAFEVTDGLAGFPASLVGTPGAIELKIEDETLRIRSKGNATRYLGERAPVLKADDGFVDTGDRVELRDGRYYFAGRSGGVVNVGGLKVYPEEVEAVINSHPWVRMSLVKARRSPITGAVVTADVVLTDRASGQAGRPSDEVLSREIIDNCRHTLVPYKVPAMIRFVPSLEVSASGKLVRPRA